jgi:uncharacterized integral membrane protein
MADTIVSKGLTRIRQLPRRTVVAIVIAVVALIFILQNTRNTQIHVLFWHSDLPLWLWLVLVVGAGFIVGSMYPWFHRRGKVTRAETPTTEPRPPQPS